MIAKEKSLLLIALLAICLLHSNALAVSIEQTMSLRYSARSYTNANITRQELLEVLHAAYGFWNAHRSIPRTGNDYSLIIFPVNATGSYRYIPESNSLVVHDLSVNKGTIRPRFAQSYPCDASFVLIVVWNQTRMDNGYFASAEAGCFVQNTYLAAASLNLGTTCVTTLDSPGLRADLKLPSTYTPLLAMPLSYPTSPYSAASPDYARMTHNLPPVQYSSLDFTTTLNNLLFTEVWSEQNLSLQELSQLLWAAYGYSSTGHRTTPSAYGIYPLTVYYSNATGTYWYIPETHSVMVAQLGDRRLEVANACGNQAWAANAPAIFLVVYNSSYNGGNTGDGGAVPHMYIEVDTGCVVQQLLLEASAWNLSANTVGNGFEMWNGTAAQGLRNILGLPSSLIPLYAVPIGHRAGGAHPPLVGDINGDDKVDGKDIAIVAKYFGSIGGFPPYADVNSDGKVDGKDIAIVAKHFGEKYP
jgi:nitroreductase